VAKCEAVVEVVEAVKRTFVVRRVRKMVAYRAAAAAAVVVRHNTACARARVQSQTCRMNRQRRCTVYRCARTIARIKNPKVQHKFGPVVFCHCVDFVFP
jgi:hypothetical protein